MQLHRRLEAFGGLALGLAVAALSDHRGRRGRLAGRGHGRARACILLRAVLLHPPLLHLHLQLHAARRPSSQKDCPYVTTLFTEIASCAGVPQVQVKFG